MFRRVLFVFYPPVFYLRTRHGLKTRHMAVPCRRVGLTKSDPRKQVEMRVEYLKKLMFAERENHQNGYKNMWINGGLPKPVYFIKQFV